MRQRGKSLRSILVCVLGVATVLLWAVSFDTAYAQQCVPAPAGLVGWWPGDGNTLDLTGNNPPATLVGNASFGPGAVAQGFQLHGNPDWVDLGGATGDFGSA